VAFRVQLSALVNRQIVSWQLSDTMLVEVQLRLRQDLRENPTRSLIRLRQPFDGMCYLFSMVDPENRLREHFFAFQVLYHPDEERIIVARAGINARMDCRMVPVAVPDSFRPTPDGLGSAKLTYRHAGRDYRLTDVAGNVVKEVLA
jgi:hypothetical protein